MRFFGISLFFLTLLFPLASFAQGGANVGLVKGIWFSKDPFFAGETVRVYGAIQNNSGQDVIGNMVFYDGDEVLGEKEFSAIDGRIIEQWMDFTAKKGSRTFKVGLRELFTDDVNKEPIPSESINADASDTVFVDGDLDEDGIGDEQDDDIDGDGFSNEEEEAEGTDPEDADSQPEIEDETVADASSGTSQDQDSQNGGDGGKTVIIKISEGVTAAAQAVDNTRESFSERLESLKDEYEAELRERYAPQAGMVAVSDSGSSGSSGDSAGKAEKTEQTSDENMREEPGAEESDGFNLDKKLSVFKLEGAKLYEKTLYGAYAIGAFTFSNILSTIVFVFVVFFIIQKIWRRFRREY